MTRGLNAPLVAAIGARESGKSAWVKQQLRRANPRRLLIWDPQNEFGKFGKVYKGRAGLLALFDAVVGAKSFAVVFQPGDDATTYAEPFDRVNRLCYALGNLTYVVDELADVTLASRAPASWGVVSRKGRHKGVTVYACSQRAASVDKDFFGNCTLIHCGRQFYKGDVQTMADVLNVPADDVRRLPNLHYFELAAGATESRRGVLTF